MKIKLFVAATITGALVLTGCSKNPPPPPAYNETWTTHYVDGQYDRDYDYGLGFIIIDGRRKYNVPKSPPPVIINNYNNNGGKPATPSKPAPTIAPAKPSEKPKTETPKPTAPKVDKPKVETPKPAAPAPRSSPPARTR